MDVSLTVHQYHRTNDLSRGPGAAQAGRRSAV